MKEIFKFEKSQENIKKNDNIKNNINDEDENEVLQDMSNIKDKRNLVYDICNIEFSNDELITVIIKFIVTFYKQCKTLPINYIWEWVFVWKPKLKLKFFSNKKEAFL